MPTSSADEPLDIRRFLAAAEAASDDKNGFDLDDVLAVEEAWEQDDDEAVTHGFIVSMRGGDRLYVEYSTQPEDEDDEGELTIMPLETALERPDLEHLEQEIVWYKADHITTHIYTLRSDTGTQDAES